MTDDLDRLMEVMTVAFDPLYQEAWTRRQVEDALMMGNCRYFLIDESGKPIIVNSINNKQMAGGFYLSRQIVTETELLLFAVNPAFRRRGLGFLLLQHLLESSRSNGSDRIFLEMRRDNPAEHLYRRFGFTPVGQRPKYYRFQDGTRVDAITFAIST